MYMYHDGPHGLNVFTLDLYPVSAQKTIQRGSPVTAW